MLIKRVVSVFLSIIFAFSICIPSPGLCAQAVADLPSPGTRITVSAAYTPALVKGITLYPTNPLRFDFIVDAGDDKLAGETLRKEAERLISYFMATLTVPENELWVNLSPYEEDRIIAEGLGYTVMGRDMLAQDYLLKQVTASLMYPEEDLGEEFWRKVYEKTQARFGTTDIPANTFNKVWIIPDEAAVYINGTSVFVNKSHLKVMLEEDYLALESNQDSTKHGLGRVTPGEIDHVSQAANEVIREVILPEIEREVNEGKTFAVLRQIYHSMILATWYKKNLKESSGLGAIYVDANKTKGIELEDKGIKNKIYNQYVAAFKKGVYDYIKDDYDESTNQIIPRKYFSGGLEHLDPDIIVNDPQSSPVLRAALSDDNPDVVITVAASPIDDGGNPLTPVVSPFQDQRDRAQPTKDSAATAGQLADLLYPGMEVSEDADISDARDNQVYLTILALQNPLSILNAAIQALKKVAPANISQASGEDLVRWLVAQGVISKSDDVDSVVGGRYEIQDTALRKLSAGMIPVARVAGPSVEAQDFWGIEILNEESLAEIKALYAQYLEFRPEVDDFFSHHERILSALKDFVGTLHEEELRPLHEKGLYLTESGLAMLSFTTESLTKEEVVELIMENTSKDLKQVISDESGSAPENFWAEYVSLAQRLNQLGAEIFARLEKTFYLGPEVQSGLMLGGSDFLPRIAAELYETPLDGNHPFVKILQVSPYTPSTLPDLLVALGITIEEMLDLVPGAEPSVEWIRAAFDRLRPYIAMSDAMPALVRERFREGIRESIFPRHLRRTGDPFQPYWGLRDVIDDSAEGFIAKMEKGLADREQRAMSSPAPGGIDLNPHNVDLVEEGGRLRINFFTSDVLDIDPAAVGGLLPVIINITPFPSVSPVLGRAQPRSAGLDRLVLR